MKVNFAVLDEKEDDNKEDKSDRDLQNHEIAEYKSSTITTVGNRNIPEELLRKIFCYTDHKALLSCQLVCKHWNELIKNYIWHKKAELTLNRPLPSNKEIPWTIYYFICDGRPFYKNLMKNHSGEDGLFKNWNITKNGGEGWNVESYPRGSKPLPDDPVFEDKNYCFSTSFSKCWKEQVVHLVDEGFSEHLLDHFQPTIKVLI